MQERPDCRKCTAIVLPSLDPDTKFQKVIAGLIEAGFEHIVIVNDGSDEAHRHFFDEAAALPQCTVLTHEINRGKGRALKTAFGHVAEKLPDLRGVITIDGDGQHLTEDIIACGQKMLENEGCVVLGCRDFDQPGVPPRSVAGNKTTSRFSASCSASASRIPRRACAPFRRSFWSPSAASRGSASSMRPTCC